MTSKREHYMTSRYSRRYGKRGAVFVGRAWREQARYFEKGVFGDVAINRIMDQAVRIQKLGHAVITDEQREAALGAIWESIEHVQQHAEGQSRDQEADGMTGFGPEYVDYLTHVWDPKDVGDVHEIPVDPAYLPPEISPVRHSQAAWEALLAELPASPEEVWQAVQVLWQLWRLKGGSKYLSWIN